MNKNYDVLIIGAGPAGIMSAIELQDSGLAVLLLDDSFSLGGQIYKNVQNNQDEKNRKLFGPEYAKGIDLINKLDLEKIEYLSNASIWSIEKQSNVYFSHEGKSQAINAKKIIIAVGSQERPFVLEGWNKPGVLSATSAQIMLKESSIIKDDAVFVGSGPLFYYVISQYIDAGAKIKAIVDTTPKENYFKSLKYLPKALKKVGILLKGLGFLFKFRKYNIKVYQFAKNIKLEGDEKLKSISFNNNENIKTDVAFIHNGLVPNINLQLQAQCDYEYNHKKRSIDIKVDKYKQSSVPSIFVIGDGQSIKGIDTALIEAKISATKILYDFEKITEQSMLGQCEDFENELQDVSCVRDFLDSLYLPSNETIIPKNDEVIVCRCEEVKKFDITKSKEIDAKGLNTIKSFTRCGMGNCQGRFCGLTLLEIMANKTNRPIEDLSYLNIRSPIRPVRINELAEVEKI
jgi:thioredoxin reductase